MANGWTRDATLLLIDLYRNNPCLYDVSSADYRNANKRSRAFEEMCEIIYQERRGTTPKDIRTKINILRTQYLKEKAKHETKKSGMSSSDVYMPRLWCYNELSFLAPYVIHNKGTSNLTQSSEESHSSTPADTDSLDDPQSPSLLDSIPVEIIMPDFESETTECMLSQTQYTSSNESQPVIVKHYSSTFPSKRKKEIHSQTTTTTTDICLPSTSKEPNHIASTSSTLIHKSRDFTKRIGTSHASTSIVNETSHASTPLASNTPQTSSTIATNMSRASTSRPPSTPHSSTSRPPSTPRVSSSRASIQSKRKKDDDPEEEFFKAANTLMTGVGKELDAVDLYCKYLGTLLKDVKDERKQRQTMRKILDVVFEVLDN